MPLNRRIPCLICYDIADPKRLARLHRKLAREAVMVQYSVYYCELTAAAIERIKEMIAGIIDPGADDVRIYTLPERFDLALIGQPANDSLPVLRRRANLRKVEDGPCP
ncbi:MAG: CRISPR-associated endonuclease Cas2 [Zetaproteobacteria bacterium]|nr:MAG: CRISPR-associated endonuclease Cas2 [Zetaproteobacteria bacterium]